MATLFVRHDVADYAAWRSGYDANSAVREGGGVLADAIYQSVDDPNDLTVRHDFADVAAAKAFASSPELHDAMAALGVVGQPTVWFVEGV
jgi:hypothetical protein